MAHEILIDAEGRVRTIYSDDIRPVLAAVGPVRVARASHVEPSEGGLLWVADMGPCGGPVLGPFTFRNEALAAEHQWLIDHGIPVPRV